jgi:hypothetical protein
MSDTNGSKAVTISAGKTPQAIVPTNFEEVQRMAAMVVAAGMFKATDKNQAVAQATMALMQGLEIGISPMQAANGIAIINGRPCIWGSLVPALIWKAGHRIEEWVVGEEMEMVAHCRITRSDNDIAIERTFSMKEAKAAGLLDKPGPWKQYRRRMLAMRARGFAANDGVPDVLRGMYTVEEMQDVTEEHRGEARGLPDIPAPPELADDAEFLREATQDAAGGRDPDAVRQSVEDRLAAEEQLDLEASIAADIIRAELVSLQTKALNCTTKEELDEAWEGFEAATDGRLGAADLDAAQACYDEQLARLG